MSCLVISTIQGKLVKNMAVIMRIRI